MAPREHHTWAINHVTCGWIVLFSLLLLSKCLILAFGNISIQNHDSSIYKKSNCGKTLNSMYYATCRQRVCGQNKDNLCLQAARTLIWRSCAFNRRPMTMPVLDGPMTMPVLDGVKPMAITLPGCGTSESLFWKRKKKHILLDSVETNLNIWRVRWPSPRQVRVQITTSPRQVRDDRKTGLEYYSPSNDYLTLTKITASYPHRYETH